MKPTAAQLKVLEAQDEETLAAWSCELNSWRWPSELPDPEPPEYIPGGLRSAVMDWIDAKIGNRAVLRYHNRDMSDEVFESFWRGERDDPNSPYARHVKAKVDAMMTARREREDKQLAAEIVLEDILDAEELDA